MKMILSVVFVALTLWAVEAQQNCMFENQSYRVGEKWSVSNNEFSADCKCQAAFVPSKYPPYPSCTYKCKYNGVAKKVHDVWDRMYGEHKMLCSCRHAQSIILKPPKVVCIFQDLCKMHNDTLARVGVKWMEPSKDDYPRECECKRKKMFPLSPPVTICIHKEGCFDPLKEHFFKKGQPFRDCTCVYDYHQARPDHARHYHFRCAHEKEHCMASGVVKKKGEQWEEYADRTHKMVCQCVEMQFETYPIKTCVPKDGCISVFNIKGKQIFKEGDVVSHCKCVKDKKPTTPYHPSHFHWVCDHSSNPNPQPKPDHG